MSLERYYNRFSPTAKYDRSLFLAGRGLQSAELNELQDYAISGIKGIGDAIFRDGDVVRGAACVVDSHGEVTLETGLIYLKGRVREVAKSSFTVPVSGLVHIGVKYTETIVTELESPELRDPAVGARNYQEPGALRLSAKIEWDFKKEGERDPDFYPIYNIQNGSLIEQAPPPQLDAVSTALARYDREANGSYVVSGLDVSFLEQTEDWQVFSVSEGKAHVDGFEISIPHSMKVKFPVDPDTQEIDSDPYIFRGNGGVMEILLNRTPAKQILRVDITAEKSLSLTRGSYSGSSDLIPDNAVIDVIQVKQGKTLFKDYQLKAGHIDWGGAKEQPSPGSSYEIIYHCRSKAVPFDVTENGFKIKTAVEGTMVLVKYAFALPRCDIITISSIGAVGRTKGFANPFNVVKPKVPNKELGLAFVYQAWKEAQRPKIVKSAISAISMSELEEMRARLYDLYDLIAEERLKNNASHLETGVKKGVFVDPFFDDDMRDQGIKQTAAILNGHLTLPVLEKVEDIGRNEEPWLLPYTLEVVLEQGLQTMEMKINPYQAFAPIPSKVLINLNVDRWTEVETNWSSPVTKRFQVNVNPVTEKVVSGSGARASVTHRTAEVLVGTDRTEHTELLKSSQKEIAFMRPLTQNFTVEGFKAGERLRLVFDGIDITPTATIASVSGKIEGKFTVPAKVPVGTKQVQFIGDQGNYGETTYTARGIITTEERMFSDNRNCLLAPERIAAFWS